ncbi:hypothetical protein [Methanobacterium paludis]|uniref:Uncharacterized protein n=1 Tax=Methanobacterium paludis (strain DSM 25820 / JCM 18151 / SWAN1) TaxID=868131 RepID=F6D398_METPW|nr:hypothetical protein [Methanobacterium paludis]AEG18690.1 hypothetical protein MSWAN_1679 [Methanobacterium paludis]
MARRKVQTEIPTKGKITDIWEGILMGEISFENGRKCTLPEVQLKELIKNGIVKVGKTVEVKTCPKVVNGMIKDYEFKVKEVV